MPAASLSLLTIQSDASKKYVFVLLHFSNIVGSVTYF